jgi:hypothetical protein
LLSRSDDLGWVFTRCGKGEMFRVDPPKFPVDESMRSPGVLVAGWVGYAECASHNKNPLLLTITG